MWSSALQEPLDGDGEPPVGALDSASSMASIDSLLTGDAPSQEDGASEGLRPYVDARSRNLLLEYLAGRTRNVV